MHFALALANGHLIDSTRDRKPATFAIGDGSLPGVIEVRLHGLRAGDDERFDFGPDEVFGPHRADNVRTFERGRFAGMVLEQGLLVSFAGPGGELPGLVCGIDGDRVTVDFNHPLAGKPLRFDVTVLRVE